MKYKDVVQLPGFKKDLKKLGKKYKTIALDLETFINTAVKLRDDEHDYGIVRVTGAGFENPVIFKGKSFACRSLKGKGKKSGIRVVFAYFPEEERIELVEIYHKAKQANHDIPKLRELYK